MFSPTTPSKIFRDQVPEDFLERTVRCLVASCQQAKQMVGAFFPKPEAHDLRGHYCRAVFEKEWRTIAAQSIDMHGRAVLNKRGTYYHTRITCGSIIMTASQVSHPKVMVRHADFRDGYARDAQMDLFGEMPEPPAPESPVYAMLLYGLDKKTRTFPVFADFVFPDSKCGRYVDRIELFLEYASLINQLVGSQIVVPAATSAGVAPEPELKYRKPSESKKKAE
jgi:hypothetical protein